MVNQMTTDVEEDEAQRELKRAYVLTSYGFFEEALESCERAATLAEEDLVPRTIHGAILTASGRPAEAMKALIRLHREYKDSILCRLYLAEACFLAGRHRRGWKTLDSIDADAIEDSPWADFYRDLRTTWEELAEVEDLPGPLVIPLD